jgi:hypothetical protein
MSGQLTLAGLPSPTQHYGPGLPSPALRERLPSVVRGWG